MQYLHLYEAKLCLQKLWELSASAIYVHVYHQYVVSSTQVGGELEMGSVGACGTAINFTLVGPWRILFLYIAFKRHASAVCRSYRIYIFRSG